MTLRVDDDVILVCEATSDSPPTLSWEREGEPFPEGRTVKQGGKLEIKGIQKDDYGVYTCVATSNDGQAKHSTTIAVICKLNCLHFVQFVKPRRLKCVISALFYSYSEQTHNH